MNSITNRLTAVFALLVLGALGVVWLVVVPTLAQSLRDQELEALLAAGRRHAGQIQALVGTNASGPRVDRAVREAADAASARVTLLRFNRGTEGLQGFVQSDSTAQGEIRDLAFAVADIVARTGRPQLGTEPGDAGRVGEAALPLVSRPVGGGRPVVGSVLVLSRPLDAVEAQVDLVSRRLLQAAGIALVLALSLGYLVARGVTGRVRLLERIARRMAAGDFGARFELAGDDELARLARALDDLQRQLADLDDARSRFIATASHELRTPLFSLRGFVELLESEELDADERAEALAQLRAGVDRLSRLATDLLDLSRLEAGAVDLRLEPVDVGELAQRVAGEFQPALAAHESRIEVRLGGDRGRVEAVCDPDRVAQIMRILVDNALRHTPSGTDVIVSTTRRDGRLRLSITDFGPGIRRTSMPHVFEPFFTSDDAQGSGLGLAIARELAERMEGDLSAESVPGRTTFALELPA